jgi:hypothetical protein
MIESVNLTAYIILCVLLYSFLIKFILINSNQHIRELYEKVNLFIYSLITKNIKVKGILHSIYTNIILPSRTVFIKVLVYLKISCEGLFDFTASLDEKFHSGLGQSADYASLTIRKLYDGNAQLYIVYSTAVIVVFYFILTVF